MTEDDGERRTSGEGSAPGLTEPDGGTELNAADGAAERRLAANAGLLPARARKTAGQADGSTPTSRRQRGQARSNEQAERSAPKSPPASSPRRGTSAGISPSARPASLLIAGRPISEYQRQRDYPGHFHTMDDIVGYVVRETVRDGKPLHHGEPDERGRYDSCGYDVLAVDGACRYAETFPTRDAYRRKRGGYAVVDMLYACGCRSW